MDAVRDGRSDGSRVEAGNWVWRSVNRIFLGTNLGRPIVTNGDFAAYLYVNRPSCVFRMVCGVGRGIGVLIRGPRCARGRAVFGVVFRFLL